ncbi:MAG: hypothetical protein OEV94_11380 [Deltaproteobacteria bacterium]|nr:hypothetical protein [Deltaproteobacteria bacterium]
MFSHRAILPLVSLAIPLFLSGCQIPKVYRGTEFLLPTCGYCPIILAPTTAQATTLEDTVLNVTLTVTDTDSAVVTLAVSPTTIHGALVCPTAASTTSGSAAAGYTFTFACTYTPNPNYNGTDSFSAVATDDTLPTGNASTTVTVPLTITPVNDAPTLTGVPVIQNVNSGTAVNITLANMGLTGGDVDIATNADTISYTMTGQPTGTLTAVAFSMDPATGTLTGTASGLGLASPENYTLAVTVTDSKGATATQNVTLKVTDITAPSAPTGMKIKNGGSGSTMVVWTPPADADYKGMHVCRAVVGATDAPCGGTGWQLVGNIAAGTNQAQDVGLTNGTSYTYKILAYDEVPNYSLAATASGVAGIIPLTTSQAASLVLGQPGFVSSTGGTSSTLMRGPTGVAVAGGRMYVAEDNNTYVKGYLAVPTAINTPADFVLGSTALTAVGAGTLDASNFGWVMAMDADATHLAVSDDGFARVMIWSPLPTTTGTAASVVVGQLDFVTVTAACATNTIKGTWGVGLGGGKLLIADSRCNRVLIYNTIPTANGANASLVLGQANFTGGLINQGATPTASTMNFPSGIWTDGTKLAVADYGNSRVLLWNTFPTANGQAANIVLGQAGFTTNACPLPSATTLCNPAGVYSNGVQLFVTDGANRVMVWNSWPTVNAQAADVVLGEPNMTSGNTCAVTSAQTLCFTYNYAWLWADLNNLIVGDRQNQRVLFWP